MGDKFDQNLCRVPMSSAMFSSSGLFSAVLFVSLFGRASIVVQAGAHFFSVHSRNARRTTIISFRMLIQINLISIGVQMREESFVQSLDEDANRKL